MSDEDRPGLALFEGFGIEIEYMIVDQHLDVAPIADRVLIEGGEVVSDLERGEIAWSNELVSHVVELKTNGPASRLDGLSESFQASVGDLQKALEPHGGRLLPTAMHPWMQPQRDTVLWPHEHGQIYAIFDRIFGCRGHGWSNLQSMHINLPFRGEGEMVVLHDAIRAVLPLLPALAASSPIVQGAATGLVDNRLEHYRHNCRALPVVTGHVIPERVDGEASYRRDILGAIAEAVAPYDPDGVLDPEWVNARGAIVRFVRDSIEIRVLDVQEHPGADLAIARLVVGVLRGLVEQRWAEVDHQRRLDEVALERVLLDAIRDGERARVADPGLLACFGLTEPLTMGELWRHLAEASLSSDERGDPALGVILDEGTLARRILHALGDDHRRLPEVYTELGACLAQGRSFSP